MVLSNKSYFSRVLREADAWTNLGMHRNITYCYRQQIEGISYISSNILMEVIFVNG